MTPKGLQVSTPTDTAIVLIRTFAAPRRLVWEAFFSPAKMRRWLLPPPGWTLAECECDPRVGGALRLVFSSGGTEPGMIISGEFTEVVPMERIVHTETMAFDTGMQVGSLVETHEFSETGGTTTMRITQVYDSKTARDGALSSGMEQGMEAGYQQLDTMLAQPA